MPPFSRLFDFLIFSVHILLSRNMTDLCFDTNSPTWCTETENLKKTAHTYCFQLEQIGDWKKHYEVKQV